MPRRAVTITTSDGNCPASVFTPTHQQGLFPGVLFYMDGLGIRPMMWEMGQRLADLGYVVLLPDLFYRNGPSVPLIPKEALSQPDFRVGMMKLIGTLTRDRKIADAAAFFDYLVNLDEVSAPRVGVTGYCMGGNVALTAAGAFPDKVAAIASFHGGNLAADNSDSPHHFVGGITGQVYIGAAIHDSSFPEEQKSRLEQAFIQSGVSYLMEIYPALHGFAVPDLPAYDREAAERHWIALAQFFKQTL